MVFMVSTRKDEIEFEEGGEVLFIVAWRRCQRIVAEVSLVGCHGGCFAGFDWLGGDRRGSADFELANHRQMPSALNITHVSLENKNLKRAKV